MWRKLIMGDELWVVGCLPSEPILAPSEKRIVRRLGEAATPGEGSASRALT